MRARTGKIARLPQAIRHQLNERLERCEAGAQILGWLHALPEVRKLLADEFGGDPVTKQNLSHWRQGGFRDWLAHEDIRSGLAGADELTADWKEGRELEIIDKAAALLSARFATLLSRWNSRGDADFEADSRVLNGFCASVLRLQKQMHQTGRERHEFQRAVKAEMEADDEKARNNLVQPWFDIVLKLPKMAQMFGGGSAGVKIAQYVLAVQNNRMDSPEATLKFTDDDTFEPFVNGKSSPPIRAKRSQPAETKPLEEKDINAKPPPPSPTLSKVVQP